MNRKRKHLGKVVRLLTLLSVLTLMWFLATGDKAVSRAQSAQDQNIITKQATVPVQGPMRGPMLKNPPARQKLEQEESEEHKNPAIDTPIDPTVKMKDIRPANPPSFVNLMSDKDGGDGPLAPGTFTFFRNATSGNRPPLPGAPPTCPGIMGNCDASPYEPSVGVNGRVVFYTTNNYAAVSGDRGQNWSYINPYDNFPADGTVDPVHGFFGGDQYVYYVPTHGLMCWLIQYRDDGATNRQRLAIARSQADVLNNNWIFYDFSPATFNLTDPRGIWLDYPDISVSDNFLYLTTNVFTVSPQASRGSVISRIPLTQLVQGTNLSFLFFNDTTHLSLRLTHGAHDTMYWGRHNSNTQISIYRWPENSNNIPAPDNVNHAAYILNSPVRGSYVATCAGGTNFMSFQDDRINGAWVANGVIGFMWDVAQGGGFTRPHVEVVRFDESTRNLLPNGQGQIFNNDYAYSYSSVHPNGRGHLGGTIAFGCGGSTGNPGVAAWIADDFNNNTITPLESIGAVVGNASQGRWGDYFSTRIYSPFSNTWVGTGFSLNPAVPPATQIPRDHRFVWFGRERDMPSATNVIFVSLFNTSGYGDGTIFHPYNTLSEGHLATMAGDTVTITPANYHEPQILNRPGTYQRTGATGTVTIGP